MNRRKKLHSRKLWQAHRAIALVSVMVSLISLGGAAFLIPAASGASSADTTLFLSISYPQPFTSQPPIAIVGGGGGGGGGSAAPSNPFLTYLLPPPPPYIPPHQDTRRLAQLAPESRTTQIPFELPPTATLTKLRVLLVTNDGVASSDGNVGGVPTQGSVPLITNVTPTFSGKVGIPHSLVLLEVHSDPTTAMTTTVQADEKGYWSWQVPRPLAAEVHTLYVTAFDPKGEVRLATAVLQFEIVTPETFAERKRQQEQMPKDTATTTARTVVGLPPSLVDQRMVLFDIRAEVVGLDPDEVLHPGDDLLVKVSLLNIGSPGYLVDALVTYTLMNSAGKIMFQEQETVGVSTAASYLKSFATSRSLPSDQYRVEIAVSYGDTQAFASDEFRVGGEPIVALPGRARVNVSVLLQALIAIFGIALLVAYFEYRTAELLGAAIRMVNENDLKKYGYIT